MSELAKTLSKGTNSTDEAWISTSDMMSGLMMVFLFIAIVYIENVGRYIDDINISQQRICGELQSEFATVQSEWMISICEDGLVVKFENDAIFSQGSDQLNPDFQVVLGVFFPKFMNIIWQNRKDISELRIEGHTSSEGGGSMNQFESYLYNTQLSQNRSRNVMGYVLSQQEILRNTDYLDWSYNNLTAHGLSSSDLIFTEDNLEDQIQSRRVEFRLRTTAQDRLIDLVRDLDETR